MLGSLRDMKYISLWQILRTFYKKVLWKGFMKGFYERVLWRNHKGKYNYALLGIWNIYFFMTIIENLLWKGFYEKGFMKSFMKGFYRGIIKGNIVRFSWIVKYIFLYDKYWEPFIKSFMKGFYERFYGGIIKGNIIRFS